MIKTIETARLDSQEVLNELKKVKFLICDIDYTVSDFGVGNQYGINEVEKYLGEDIATEVERIFNLVLRGHRNLNLLSNQEKIDFKTIMDRINRYTPKFWCRELYIILAAKKFGKDLYPAEVMEGADKYWKGVSEKSEYYPDAVVFMKQAMSLSLPIVWMTGSDSRTRISKNGQGEWEILYDPEHSRELKMKRLEKLLSDFPGSIEIGDPVDKPEPGFYDLVFAHADGIKYEDILVVGDSEISDLENAKKRGCRTVLVKR